MKKINYALLAINLFFLQAYLIRFSIGPYPSNLQEIFIAANFGLFITISLKKHRHLPILQKLFKFAKNHWAITSFFLLTIGSSLLPKPEFISYIRHLKFIFFAILLTIIFIQTLKTSEERKKGLRFAGIGAVTFGLFSIIYNLLGLNQTFDNRLLGPLDSAVYLAYYLTPFFIFFTIEFFTNLKNGISNQKSNLLLSLILGSLIILTRSMGAIGGSFIVISFFLLTKSDFKILKSKIARTSMTIIGILIVGAIFYTKIVPTFSTTYSSMDERGEIWKTSIHILKEPKNLIFGVGLGQFEYKYIAEVKQVINNIPLDYYVIQPHNIFLLFLFHYGIMGLSLILFCIYKTMRQILISKDESTRTIASFMLLYFFIHGLIDTPIFKNDLLIIFIILLEVSLNTSHKKIRELPSTI